MKRLRIIFLLILILMPVFTFAECTQEEISEYKKLINDVKVDINFVKDKSGDVGNSYAINIKNIPEGVSATIYNDNIIRYCTKTIETTFIQSGGIYKIDYVPDKCAKTSIKSFDFYLPDITDNHSDADILKNIKKEVKKSSILLLLLLIIIITVIIILISIKRKKRLNKNEV